MIPAITSREIAAALYGAMRLARGDPHGIDFFEDSVEGFWKSFWAAAIVAPAYAILLAINLDDAEIKSGILRIGIVESTAYVAGWAAFPLAMHYVAEFLDREERYLRYIAAANWCSVLQVGLYLFVTAFLALDILPRPLAQGTSLITHAAIFVYQWFVARVGLDISGRAAAGIVVLDLAISLLLDLIVRAML